jgi:hypothetical protein
MQACKNIKGWVIFLVAAGFAVFSSPNIFAEPASEMSGVIRETSDRGVAYMTGGVGIGEREIMESWGKDYNLKLSFTEKSGVYLADVGVVVEDRNGNEMINITTNGPWLYLQLPPGSYTVKTTYNDEARRIENLRVSGGDRVRRVVRWDLPEEFPVYASMKQGRMR